MTYNNSGTLLVERVEAIPINMQPPQPVGYEIHFSASKVAKMDGFDFYLFVCLLVCLFACLFVCFFL